MTNIEVLQRKLDRETRARLQAEAILEQKALELFNANNELRTLNENLEGKIIERTRALAQSEMRLAGLIANMDYAIIVGDNEHNIILVNQAFCDMFGFRISPDSLAGLNYGKIQFKILSYFEDRAAAWQEMDTALTNNTKVIGEVCRLKDGRTLERDYIPIRLDGELDAHLWVYRDVTQKSLSDEKLRQSEEKYRGIIENMELGLVELDTEGRVLRSYSRFCEMVGYTAQELEGRNLYKMLLPSEFQAVLSRQSKDREAGKAGIYEIQLIRKDGSRLWTLISGAPIQNLAGGVKGSIGIYYDISHQKKLQQDLEAAKRHAEEAQEAEKQFLANMSHEIRTPLNAIIGMSHLLYDTHPTDEQKEYLAILKNSAEMLRALISDVLDLSKIRAGKVEVQNKEFDLVGMIRSIIKSAQLRFENKPIRANCQLDERLQTLVIGDDLLLNQILHNLFGNAEKFTLEGQIGINVRLASRKDGIMNVEFVVYDSGIGIPSDKIELIFQSFRQVDGDIKRKFGGTGLGLAITKQLIELQGGSIQVESKLGEGSRFIFTLPYRDTGKRILQTEKTISQNAPLNAEGKQLLVVEDNYMNRKYISTLLKKWNLDFKMAFNGREAVELAREVKFNLIFMDIQMPEMDGYEATIAIRNSANLNQHTPIIALTASALTSEKDVAFNAGMNDFLTKPFKPAQLYEKLQEYYSDNRKDQLTEGGDEDAPFRFNSRLDAYILESFYGDDFHYMCEMFGAFLEDTVPLVQKLRPALNANNWVELAVLAHKVKPAFGIVGLPDLQKSMQQLEQMAKYQPDKDKLNNLLREVEMELPELIEAVRSDHAKLQLVVEVS